jgi:hypothetical protein
MISRVAVGQYLRVKLKQIAKPRHGLNLNENSAVRIFPECPDCNGIIVLKLGVP